jgi:hypothetical protein
MVASASVARRTDTMIWPTVNALHCRESWLKPFVGHLYVGKVESLRITLPVVRRI